MTAHRIRLRGPWQLEESARQDAGGQDLGQNARQRPRRVRIPADWTTLMAETTGRIRLTRRFHQPTHLEPSDEVALVFERWPGGSMIELNGLNLGHLSDPPNSTRFVVTGLLTAVNLLAVEFDRTAVVDEPFGRDNRSGDAALEIVGKT